MKKYRSGICCVMVCMLLLAGCGTLATEDSTGGESVFLAEIVDLYEGGVVVEALESEEERKSADQFSFGTADLEDIGARVGDTVSIIYTGEIMETYPAQIHAVGWSLRETAKDGETEKTEENLSSETSAAAKEELPERESECEAVIFGTTSLLEPGGGVFELLYANGHEDEIWYYDEFFTLERYVNGEWKALPVLTGLCGVTSFEEIYKDTPDLQEFNWKYLYGELEPGIYCIGKEVFPDKDGGPDHDAGVMVYAEFELRDSLGLSLLVWDESSTGLSMEFVRYADDPKKELFYGSWYRIDRLEYGEWVPVDYAHPDENIAWTSEAYIIEETPHTDVVDWEWLYGELPPGQYRFCKQVMDFREAGDYDEYEYTANFMIP